MKKKRKFLWIPVILILAFIFTQSFLNQRISNKESEIVKENIVQPIREAVTGKTTSVDTVRDMAHVVEFVALGFGLTFFLKNKKLLPRALRSISYCGMIALIDESIQFLSNRAPEVADIWSDIFGGAIGTLAAIAVILIASRIRPSKR